MHVKKENELLRIYSMKQNVQIPCYVLENTEGWSGEIKPLILKGEM
jgi:hypothetical protein